ncbi:MAG TPA: signal peptidase I [Candidatus Baltobacteraceae bacterium]|nr:signal peptidase I [Candidatus Baltobacteraceae bacterium]
MTPLELLGLIALFAVIRVAISVRREPVAVTVREPAGGAAEAPRAPVQSASMRQVVREYLDAFIVAGLVALFLITFVVRTFYIPSGSMEPTLQIHDILLVNEFEYRFSPPHEGDIVVFTPPVSSPNDFIKRAVGLPGDHLRVHDGVVYRNGVAMNEPYIAEKPNYELQVKDYGIYVDGVPLSPLSANVPPRSDWTAPDRLPKGCYIMFGDNRTDSEDSHIWGCAQTGGRFFSGERKGEKASFTGRAFLLFWPPNRIRILH